MPTSEVVAGLAERIDGRAGVALHPDRLAEPEIRPLVIVLAVSKLLECYFPPKRFRQSARKRAGSESS